MVTAMKEAEAELAKKARTSAADGLLRSAVKMEHRHAEPRVIDLAEALLLVQEEWQSSYPELAATAETAIGENEADGCAGRLPPVQVALGGGPARDGRGGVEN